uniref:hypothetical protein n=1 Tax=Nostoc sp. TaxID=1180 RepID=UPI00359469D4
AAPLPPQFWGELDRKSPGSGFPLLEGGRGAGDLGGKCTVIDTSQTSSQYSLEQCRDFYDPCSILVTAWKEEDGTPMEPSMF